MLYTAESINQSPAFPLMPLFYDHRLLADFVCSISGLLRHVVLYAVADFQTNASPVSLG
jgi:hypothetical protein